MMFTKLVVRASWVVSVAVVCSSIACSGGSTPGSGAGGKGSLADAMGGAGSGGSAASADLSHAGLGTSGSGVAGSPTTGGAATGGSDGNGGGQAGSGLEPQGGAGGATGGGGSGGLGVRFVGFIGDGPNDDLPATSDFTTTFSECSFEPSKSMPPLPRFNECFARGIVKQMNQALRELIADAPLFHFESFEVVTDPKLAVYHSDPSSDYEAQHLQGNTYRRGNTMTFVMPSTYSGTIAGSAFNAQSLNPDFGMLAIAVPLASVQVFLHEFGHAIGFPHAGNAAGVGTFTYDGCGGVTLAPPACLCEGANYMSSGAFPDTSGCSSCAIATRSTYATPFFGPKYAAIAQCWLTRRLESSPITFLNADCFAIVGSAVATCTEAEPGAVTCACPSGQIFTVDSCTDATQTARNAAAGAACDRIKCPPPPERPGVVCEGLVGAPTIPCTCEDHSQQFYLGKDDCSTLTLANIEHFCPAP